MSGVARVGCSGWVYKHWRGPVYPSDLPSKKWFGHYATLFDTVEINNSFYRLPTEAAAEGWAAQAPPGFVYALKLGQFGLHRMKLDGPDGLFWMGERLGSWLAEGHDVYAYFNNDDSGFAVEDAHWLHGRLGNS